MGFFDIAKKVVNHMEKEGTRIRGDMEKRKEHIERNKSLYEKYDTNTLVRMYKESDGDKKKSIGLVLRDRGVGN